MRAPNEEEEADGPELSFKDFEDFEDLPVLGGEERNVANIQHKKERVSSSPYLKSTCVQCILLKICWQQPNGTFLHLLGGDDGSKCSSLSLCPPAENPHKIDGEGKRNDEKRRYNTHCMHACTRALLLHTNSQSGRNKYVGCDGPKEANVVHVKYSSVHCWHCNFWAQFLLYKWTTDACQGSVAASLNKLVRVESCCECDTRPKDVAIIMEVTSSQGQTCNNVTRLKMFGMKKQCLTTQMPSPLLAKRQCVNIRTFQDENSIGRIMKCLHCLHHFSFSVKSLSWRWWIPDAWQKRSLPFFPSSSPQQTTTNDYGLAISFLRWCIHSWRS